MNFVPDAYKPIKFKLAVLVTFVLCATIAFVEVLLGLYYQDNPAPTLLNFFTGVAMTFIALNYYHRKATIYGVIAPFIIALVIIGQFLIYLPSILLDF